MNSRDNIKEELTKLRSDAIELSKILKGEIEGENFKLQYQIWYTKAINLVSFLAPDRTPEFKSYYEIDPKRKKLSWDTWVIQDYVKGIAPVISGFDSEERAGVCLFNQHSLLQSLNSRIDGILANAELSIFAEIKDAELASCNQLIKISPRAAGALAGVVLEGYLQKVSSNHDIIIKKKNPTVSDLNEPLKKEEIYDMVTWRKITYLADIRNLCSHKKNEEPSKEQVQELIDGVNWVTKNVF
jgi:hypothetical protein